MTSAQSAMAASMYFHGGYFLTHFIEISNQTDQIDFATRTRLNYYINYGGVRFKLISANYEN